MGNTQLKLAIGNLKVNVPTFFPEGLVWNSYIPLKVSVFLWEVWWGKVLTLNQLKKKRISASQ